MILKARSLYFFKLVQKSVGQKENKPLFLQFVNNNLTKEVGEKGSKEGFATDRLNGLPIVDDFQTFMKVRYGIETPKTTMRLDGTEQRFYLVHNCDIIYDYGDSLIGLFSHRESIINSLFIKIKQNFADPNDISIERISYEPSLLEWITENYKEHSRIIVNAKKVKIKNDHESDVITHDDDISKSLMYLYSRSESSWEYDYLETICMINDSAPVFFTFRIYSNGKFTISHDRPYEIGKVLIEEIDNLRSHYGRNK